MHKHHSGYILILTLMVIALGTLVVTQLFNRSSAYIPFAHTAVDRERARMLAESGLQLALSQLSYPTSSLIPEKEKTAQDDKNTASKQPAQNIPKLVWAQIFPSLNRFQNITLKEDRDGVSGEIVFCITCEEGKINLNKVFDFQEKKFVGQGKAQGDMKKIMQAVCTTLQQSTPGAPDLFPSLEKFLQERTYPLQDVSELLTIKEWSFFASALFYNPPVKEEKNEKRPVYLSDLFTVSSDTATINPWLLSDATSLVLGCKRVPAASDKEQRDALITEKAASFKPDQSWQTTWDSTVGPLYGKKWQDIFKEFIPLIENRFEPKHFFVISYGTSRKVTARLFALVERPKLVQTDGGSLPVKIKKIYWN